MAEKHSFGGDWTDEKLDRLRGYLSEYTRILRNKAQYTTAYIDAFAGTGYRYHDQNDEGLLFSELATDESEKFRKGSAVIALDCEPKFDRYVFIDNDPTHVSELGKLKAQFPDLADRISIEQQDCNTYLQGICQLSWQTSRAVVFLDPYGMEVEWTTIEAIARTQAIDLWILFPLSAVNRMLPKDRHPRKEWTLKLNRFFGSEEWLARFYKDDSEPLLFDLEEIPVKDADFAKIGTYFLTGC